MAKPKHHKCKYCGEKVFWRYVDGVKVLLDEYDELKNSFPNNHYCFWEDNKDLGIRVRKGTPKGRR